MNKTKRCRLGDGCPFGERCKFDHIPCRHLNCWNESCDFFHPHKEFEQGYFLRTIPPPPPDKQNESRIPPYSSSLLYFLSSNDLSGLQQLLRTHNEILFPLNSPSYPSKIIFSEIVRFSFQNLETTKLLLGLGMNPNAQAFLPKPKTVLIAAIQANDEKRVNLALSFGADPNLQKSTTSPAEESIKIGNPVIFSLLLEAGLNLNGSLLIAALKLNAREITKILLFSGVNPNYRKGKSRYPISYVAEKGDFEMVARFIDCGADLNMAHQSALEYPVRENNIEMITYLIEKNANPNAPEIFVAAAEHHHTHLINLFLDLGANPNLTDFEVDDSVLEYINLYSLRRDLRILWDTGKENLVDDVDVPSKEEKDEREEGENDGAQVLWQWLSYDLFESVLEFLPIKDPFERQEEKSNTE